MNWKRIITFASIIAAIVAFIIILNFFEKKKAKKRAEEKNDDDDQIILAKPKLIIYDITYDDLRNPETITVSLGINGHKPKRYSFTNLANGKNYMSGFRIRLEKRKEIYTLILTQSFRLPSTPIYELDFDETLNIRGPQELKVVEQAIYDNE